MDGATSGSCSSRVNSEFLPIELQADDEDSVAVVAELVEVIGLDPPA